MEYKCSSCGYETPYKCNAERHVNKKKKCGVSPKMQETIVDTSCMYCGGRYKTKDILKRHKEKCKAQKNNLSIEIIDLKEQVEELKKKQVPIIINGNITNNDNSNTNTINYIIQLRPYNDPRLPEDMDDVYKDAWERQKSVHTFIERIHFNSEFPENHNICITNLRTKLAAKVFNGDKWETKDQNKIIDEIVENTNKALDKWIKADHKRRAKYERDFVSYVEREGKEKFDEEIKNELKLLLYDSYKNGVVNIKTTSQIKENVD